MPSRGHARHGIMEQAWRRSGATQALRLGIECMLCQRQWSRGSCHERGLAPARLTKRRAFPTTAANGCHLRGLPVPIRFFSPASRNHLRPKLERPASGSGSRQDRLRTGRTLECALPSSFSPSSRPVCICGRVEGPAAVTSTGLGAATGTSSRDGRHLCRSPTTADSATRPAAMPYPRPP
ncbi:hypothetical protein GGTG_12199 [Gaeumannomyces tritici R3-111a-1]|uniref:Uncharacterized protein n=1 Tax=Gaeumannomyces tritici (strain R3-111a-1) TaxID=644352 RepID=J3PFC2_GAET3|nr:hypothetical protein GGTG_12199 [Gaeumannomyces tritici R3-111a-1]EJT70024.1 hypothetical protein GGTG_12199 [Gaeumannomyces tritici R3-111a-1]